MKKTLSTILIAVVGSISITNANADDLLSVYNQALLNDTVVLKAKAQYEIVKEDVVQARSALLPQISGYANYTDGVNGFNAIFFKCLGVYFFSQKQAKKQMHNLNVILLRYF